MRRGDAFVGASSLLLVALASLVGGLLYLAGKPVHASAAPFFAQWLPHVGPGTPLAITVAVLVIWKGPVLAARLAWRPLVLSGYAVAVVWTLALALVDGWQRGLTGRLTTKPEYLHEVPGVTDVTAMIRGFAGRILDAQPDSWTTHVAGHPPGALLTFVWLDRIGLGGGAWAAVLCVMVGALAAVAVPETVRLLGDPDAARVAVPFAVLLPGAVWIGASADGLFAGVAAVGTMLLARQRPHWDAVGGALLGFGLYLSYGLVLLAPIVLVVLVRRRAWRSLGIASFSAAVVVGVFTAYGFWWFDGYHLVVERYYQGLASVRPYWYWVWANLAALVASGGPAMAVILRRAMSLQGVLKPRRHRPSGERNLPRAVMQVAHSLRESWHRGVEWPIKKREPAWRRAMPRQPETKRRGQSAPAGDHAPSVRERRFVLAASLLPVAAATAVLLADISGLSKAETERIWLPFAVWFAAGAVLLPADSRRFWLAVQATTALLVNHLLLTSW
ncbi:hypothetical protein AB0J80_34735 [Actinoplanes sp. NPDC049548]|uniref:hypothetical protein n=1 Tax=Actinoplanes sp. NPDC049548 TaxID=3155152 RepID=UPI0034308F9D